MNEDTAQICYRGKNYHCKWISTEPGDPIMVHDETGELDIGENGLAAKSYKSPTGTIEVWSNHPPKVISKFLKVITNGSHKTTSIRPTGMVLKFFKGAHANANETARWAKDKIASLENKHGRGAVTVGPNLMKTISKSFDKK